MCKRPHHDNLVVRLCPQRGLVWSQLPVLSVQELCTIQYAIEKDEIG